ncbi:MAG TPA: hypothetical protein PLR06_07405 [Cyclobacteriaceae bacterium]|nr:hypothetical protein [Cyclobacteriaceae bacterium]
MSNELKKADEEQNIQELVGDLEERLRKKQGDLVQARLRLQRAKHNIHRLKKIITVQRDLLLKLYH